MLKGFRWVHVGRWSNLTGTTVIAWEWESTVFDTEVEEPASLDVAYALHDAAVVEVHVDSKLYVWACTDGLKSWLSTDDCFGFVKKTDFRYTFSVFGFHFLHVICRIMRHRGRSRCFKNTWMDNVLLQQYLRGCSMATSILQSKFQISNYHLPRRKFGFFFSINTFMCALNHGAW
jgi:hypothetical protein